MNHFFNQKNLNLKENNPYEIKRRIGRSQKKAEALNIKHAELTDEQLKSVTGGWSQNADGTYNIYAGEHFYLCYGGKIMDYCTAETRLNMGLDTLIDATVKLDTGR